jgi:hypothetical protein
MHEVEGRVHHRSLNFGIGRVLRLWAAVTLMLRCAFSSRPPLRMLAVFGNTAYSKGIELGLSWI